MLELGGLDMLVLMANTRKIFTDYEGIQKKVYLRGAKWF